MTERAPLPEEIATPRLRLRRWRLSDVEDVLRYAQDPEWSRYLRMLPQPYTSRDAEQFLARQLVADPVSHPAWAISLDGVAVGGLNLRFRFEHRLAELGYSIARAHWNRGYVSEAARAVIDAAFTAYADLNRITAFADARNTASQRVMEKVGMTREGVLRQNRVERGVPMDEAWYGILRSEWALGWRRLSERPAAERDGDAPSPRRPLVHRRATEADLDLLARWNHQLIQDEGHRNPMDVPELRSRMRGWLAGEYEAVLFEEDGTPLAYALFRRDGHEIYIRHLFVDRERRRSGIGREALRLLLSEIVPDARRLVAAVLTANRDGREFWAEVGFRDYAVEVELVRGDA